MESSRDTLLKLAKRVMRNTKHPEDNVRHDIGRLLDALEVENILTYRTDAGPADLYLPRRRTIIETKAIGLADDPERTQARDSGENGRQQLERYLHSERKAELASPPLEGDSDLRWTGLLTDGVVWHGWHYDPETGDTLSQCLKSFRPGSAEELLDRLVPLVTRAAIGKPWIPTNPVAIFEPFVEQLHKIHEGLTGKVAERTDTKRQLWLEMLRTSNMEPESEAARQRLFVTHSFLVTLARGVMHTLAAPVSVPDPDPVLEDGFVSWIPETTHGRNWARQLLDRVHGYEWRRQRGDVMRPLYEKFVDPHDRQDFGEFYTPDWLAELMVQELLDDKWCAEAVEAGLAAAQDAERLRGTGVLDPACGSGTFLFHAAKRILRSKALADMNLTPVKRASVVARLVNGIDVHPVAAEIARTTVLRALPAEPEDGKAAVRIYEGDALLIRAEDETSLFRPTNGELRFLTPRGTEILLPRTFVTHQAFGDRLRRVVEAARNETAVPADILRDVPENDRNTLTAAHEKLVSVVRKEGNSVWTWYIANTTGPLLISERKVNRIAANPPWVSMAGIQAVGRKRALEAFAKKTGLWTGGQNAPHFDIAQLFVRHCRDLYLSDRDDPAAWLVKRSALRAGGWTRFREWQRGESVLAQSIDLEAVQPFGGGDARRCCILFERRASSLAGEDDDQVVATLKEPRRRPEASMGLEEANGLLAFARAPARLPREASAYRNDRGEPPFRQGASIVPKVLTVIQSAKAGKRLDEMIVETVLSSKQPWREIPAQTGSVPKGWLRPFLASSDLFPFGVADGLSQAIIPVDGNGKLFERPATVNAFWAQLERLYEEFRGKGAGTPQSLRARIDYGMALSRQLERAGEKRKRMVLYHKSGDIMRAARVVPDNTIFEDSLYYWKASSGGEAEFLTGILNAPALRRAFRESRTSGRHFHKNPWRSVPVPRYDSNNAAHRLVAELVPKAEKIAAECVATHGGGAGQQAVSKKIRSALTESGLFDRLNAAAGRILPDHVDL